MEWVRRLRPGVPDIVFGVVLVMCLLGGRMGFLNDPGTFWHVELGRQIAHTHEVPHSDGFTYTRAGEPWIDQSWGFDLLVAGIYDHWGWSGAVVATALGLAWIYGGLARGLCRDAVTPVVVVAVTVMAAGIGTIHFLTRPHLFTFAFVVWTLRECQAYHENGGRGIWRIPFVVALWANLHGGFVAGPLIVATAGLGHAISGRWDAERKRRLRGFAAVFVVSCLAALVNPYGIGLYQHVVGLLLTSGVTKLIDEYQPVPFGKSEAMVMEWFILAFIALPCFSIRRLSRYELAHLLVWLHLSLSSVRQEPLFAIVAASSLARLIDGLLSPSTNPERDRAFGRWTAWPIVASMALVVSVVAGGTWGSLDPKHWPIRAVPVLDRQPVEAKLFNEQDWGGMIEFSCQPHRRTFVDDRFELFGKPAIVEYLEALHGGPSWDALDKREVFALVWIRPKSGLALRLARDPQWRELHRDKVSVLFERRS
jgi:hypothetical protein